MSKTQLKCDACGWIGREYELLTQFPNIPNLLERIAPGEPVPFGECPKCGALCHPLEEDKQAPRVLVFVSGGVVQDVAADSDVDVFLYDADNVKAGDEYSPDKAGMPVDVHTPSEFTALLQDPS